MEGGTAGERGREGGREEKGTRIPELASKPKPICKKKKKNKSTAKTAAGRERAGERWIKITKMEKFNTKFNDVNSATG